MEFLLIIGVKLFVNPLHNLIRKLKGAEEENQSIPSGGTMMT